jgi:hypothetical protein
MNCMRRCQEFSKSYITKETNDNNGRFGWGVESNVSVCPFITIHILKEEREK